MKLLIGAAFALVLCWHSRAEEPSPAFEARVRQEMSRIDAHIGEKPLEERLTAAAAQFGVGQEELQSLLLKLVDEGLRAPDGERGDLARKIASGASSALGDLGGVRAVDPLLNAATNGPKHVKTNATIGVLYIANREAPDELPTIVRQLTSGQTFSHAYSIFDTIITHYLPADPAERERRIALIMEIFKEGLRNPDYGGRAYLDSMLEEHDPSFRRSDERRRILRELRASSNPIAREYAETKLREVFAEPANVPNDTGEGAAAAKGKSVARPAEEMPEKGAIEDSAPPSTWRKPYVIAGGVLVLGILAYVWWRMAAGR